MNKLKINKIKIVESQFYFICVNELNLSYFHLCSNFKRKYHEKES